MSKNKHQSTEKVNQEDRKREKAVESEQSKSRARAEQE